MGAPSSEDDFVAEINVTPFVDVMLVLLVIFMITAPMMAEGLNVALPKVETAETLTTEDDHAVLTIRADGALYVNDLPADMASLPEILASTVSRQGKQLYVQADKAVSYGVVLPRQKWKPCPPCSPARRKLQTFQKSASSKAASGWCLLSLRATFLAILPLRRH